MALIPKIIFLVSSAFVFTPFCWNAEPIKNTGEAAEEVKEATKNILHPLTFWELNNWSHECSYQSTWQQYEATTPPEMASLHALADRLVSRGRKLVESNNIQTPSTEINKYRQFIRRVQNLQTFGLLECLGNEEQDYRQCHNSGVKLSANEIWQAKKSITWFLAKHLSRVGQIQAQQLKNTKPNQFQNKQTSRLSEKLNSYQQTWLNLGLENPNQETHYLAPSTCLSQRLVMTQIQSELGFGPVLLMVNQPSREAIAEGHKARFGDVWSLAFDEKTGQFYSLFGTPFLVRQKSAIGYYEGPDLKPILEEINNDPNRFYYSFDSSGLPVGRIDSTLLHTDFTVLPDQESVANLEIKSFKLLTGLDIYQSPVKQMVSYNKPVKGTKEILNTWQLTSLNHFREHRSCLWINTMEVCQFHRQGEPVKGIQPRMSDKSMWSFYVTPAGAAQELPSFSFLRTVNFDLKNHPENSILASYQESLKKIYSQDKDSSYAFARLFALAYQNWSQSLVLADTNITVPLGLYILSMLEPSPLMWLGPQKNNAEQAVHSYLHSPSPLKLVVQSDGKFWGNSEFINNPPSSFTTHLGLVNYPQVEMKQVAHSKVQMSQEKKPGDLVSSLKVKKTTWLFLPHGQQPQYAQNSYDYQGNLKEASINLLPAQPIIAATTKQREPASFDERVDNEATQEQTSNKQDLVKIKHSKLSDIQAETEQMNQFIQSLPSIKK